MGWFVAAGGKLKNMFGEERGEGREAGKEEEKKNNNKKKFLFFLDRWRLLCIFLQYALKPTVPSLAAVPSSICYNLLCSSACHLIAGLTSAFGHLFCPTVRVVMSECVCGAEEEIT